MGNGNLAANATITLSPIQPGRSAAISRLSRQELVILNSADDHPPPAVRLSRYTEGSTSEISRSWRFFSCVSSLALSLQRVGLLDRLILVAHGGPLAVPVTNQLQRDFGTINQRKNCDICRGRLEPVTVFP